MYISILKGLVIQLGLQGWLGVALDAFYSLPPLPIGIIGIIITPVMVFVIGAVAEKRIIPIGVGQSRAFMPGDFCLGPTMALAVAQIPLLPKTGFWQSWVWPVLVAMVALTVVIFMRLVGDAPCYKESEGATANSPTKWYHDIMLYGVLASTMATVVLPVLLMATNTWLKAIMVAVAAVWLVGLAYDGVNPGHMNRRAMHPSDWRDRTWQDLQDDIACYLITW